jgi:hypothetical protein
VKVDLTPEIAIQTPYVNAKQLICSVAFDPGFEPKNDSMAKIGYHVKTAILNELARMEPEEEDKEDYELVGDPSTFDAVMTKNKWKPEWLKNLGAEAKPIVLAAEQEVYATEIREILDKQNLLNTENDRGSEDSYKFDIKTEEAQVLRKVAEVERWIKTRGMENRTGVLDKESREQIKSLVDMIKGGKYTIGENPVLGQFSKQDDLSCMLPMQHDEDAEKKATRMQCVNLLRQRDDRQKRPVGNPDDMDETVAEMDLSVWPEIEDTRMQQIMIAIARIA